MCGFVGYIKNQPVSVSADEKEQLERMTDAIYHRGPDDHGYYTDDLIRFGFRRLSIIDIEGGGQPLPFENERYWIVFNGEIYNYIELKEQLQAKGYTFETHSDTEVIACLYTDQRENCLQQLRGMFSFLIWDKQEQYLFGARDPFGIKPLYYTEQADGLYCGSSLNSLLQNHDIARSENNEGLHDYVTYQYVPEPQTMMTNIYKLTPGHYFIKKPDSAMQITAYWKPHFAPTNDSLEKQTQRIQDVLRDSVHMHMRSDVPVGAFLSGGIDSTVIAALAKEVNPHVKTFTVGFEREGYSEIDIAKDSAEKLNVQNEHHVITPEEFMNELPNIIKYMDDPVADPAAVPLYFVAKKAREHVKVVLSGEGSDELFGGYNIYREPGDLRLLSRQPEIIKKILYTLAQQLPEGMRGKSFLERGTTPLKDRFIGNAKLFTEQDKINLIKNYNFNYPYQRLTKPLYDQASAYSDVHKMQYIDLHTWLRGDILVKADRMTMAHSLELRVPFLDKEVFNVAAGLDTSQSIANGTTKYALRQAIKGIVPDSVLNNKKLGFPVPIRHWLRHEMYDWAYELIAHQPVGHLINQSYAIHLLRTHKNGDKDYSRKLWAIIVVIIWHALYIEQTPVSDIAVYSDKES